MVVLVLQEAEFSGDFCCNALPFMQSGIRQENDKTASGNAGQGGIGVLFGRLPQTNADLLQELVTVVVTFFLVEFEELVHL